MDEIDLLNIDDNGNQVYVIPDLYTINISLDSKNLKRINKQIHIPYTYQSNDNVRLITELITLEGKVLSKSFSNVYSGYAHKKLVIDTSNFDSQKVDGIPYDSNPNIPTEILHHLIS